MNRAARTLLSAVALALAAGATAQGTPATLLGDPDGRRAALKARGLSWDLFWSSTLHGAVRGNPDGIEAASRLDLYLDFDGKKLIGWEGGGLSTKIEFRAGELGRQGGAVLPSNAGLLSPIGFDERPVVTSLYVRQKVGGASVLLGKINAVDLLRGAPMLGGRGLDGFSHLEFAAPLSGVTPLVILGTVVSIPTDDLAWTIMAYDPNDQTNRGGIGQAFEDGVNVAVSASRRAGLTPFGGSQSLGFKFSTSEGSDLSEIGRPGENARTKRGSWCATYQIEQFLNPRWGFFGMVSWADGNPNIHQNSFQLGLSGKGLLANRPQDRFGIGYFNLGFSDALRDAILPAVRLRHEEGLETFYNWEVRPGFNLSGVAQWIRPTPTDRDDAFLLGLRAVVRF